MNQSSGTRHGKAGIVFFFLLAFSVFASGAEANTDFMAAFNGINSSTTLENNCSVCHTSIPSPRNPYGAAFALAGFTFTGGAASSADADGDGFSNGAEITAGTFPGDPNSKPAATNTAPVADNKTVTTNEDTPASITLTATDAESNPLTYSVTNPSHGTLSGSGSSRTYTPTANYNGSDSFTYRANDGTVDSLPATVSITVTSVNDAPVAVNKAVTTSANTAASVTFTATDIEGSTLTYSVVTNPAHGTVSTGTGSTRTYTPASGYSGADSFTYKANDGTVDSNTATVSITVSAATNTAPVADNKTVTTSANTPVTVTFTATDADGNSLTYSVTNPSHGTLSGSGSTRTYTPTAGYSGADSFTYKANDGTVDSNTATVSITVNAAEVTGGITVMPADGAGDVPVNTVVMGTLTGAGNIASIFNAQTFSLKVNGTVPPESQCIDDGIVKGAISYNGSNTEGTFTPNCPLTNGTAYTATIASSTSGLSAAKTWGFTTIAASPDTDDDGVPDNEDDHPGNKGKGTPPSSRGHGKFLIDVTDTAGASLGFTEGMAETNASLNQAGFPTGYDFPDGLVSYQIIGVAPGGTATVKVTFPSGIPAGSKVYKVGTAGFQEFAGATIQGNTVTLTLTDGGAGDRDGLVNGIIVDPVGVAAPVASGTGSIDLSSASGGGGCSVAVRTGSGGSYIDGTLILAGLGMAVWGIRIRRRRG
jgi:hypothetical protein